MNPTLRNPAILRESSPFAVATMLNRPAFEETPFGIATRWFLDPCDSRNTAFFLQLQRLDRLTFGPEGMPMARWIFYNMAELPGFVYGFAIDAQALTTDERARLEVPSGYVGPVPISMYIAVPTRAPGLWFGHNLASLNNILPERHLAGLGTVTKVLGLKAFGVRTSMGATQWASKALHIHSRLGPLRLHTAWTPAHSLPATLTYSWAVDDAVLRDVLEGRDTTSNRPWSTCVIAADDVEMMQEIQRDIEGGASWYITGPPERADGGEAGGHRLPLFRDHDRPPART